MDHGVDLLSLSLTGETCHKCHLVKTEATCCRSMGWVLKTTQHDMKVSESEWVSQFIHSALKAERVTSALQPRQTKMSLKVVWTTRVQRQAVAVWREDCSILSGPPPKSSCLQAECWFAGQWGDVGSLATPAYSPAWVGRSVASVCLSAL